MTIKIGLPHIIDMNTEILILGSFPGEESLSKKEYYANKKNILWKLISHIFNDGFVNINYEEKIKKLLFYKLGLWDIIESCERKGSLDKNIYNPKYNSFLHIKSIAPKLRLICFNGIKAGKHSNILRSLGFKTIILPSTSPANTSLNFEEKIKRWKEALDVK